jgi:hypothetical protein
VARAAARCGIPRQASQAAADRATRRNAADRVIRRLQEPGVYVSVAEVKRAWPGASGEQRATLRRLAPVKARLAARSAGLVSQPGPADGPGGQAREEPAEEGDEPDYLERMLDLRGVFR